MKRTVAFILALTLICLTFCACDEQTVLDTLGNIFEDKEQIKIEIEPALNEKTVELTKSIEFAPSIAGKTRIPKPLADFSLALFEKCADEDNTVISPYSIIYALALAQKGASGETFAEFEKLFGIKQDTLEEYLKMLLVSGGDDLKTSNSIWIRNSFKKKVKDDYITSSKRDFATEVFTAAFNNETLEDINAYISDKTEGLIDKALNEISEDTVMYLINTVYFKADWAIQYTGSYNGKFTNIDGTQSDAEFMDEIQNKLIKDDNAKGFIKDYKGGKYAFAAILPNENISLDDYVKTLTGEGLTNMLSNPIKTSIATALPKFETTFKTELKNILEDMGLKTAFHYGSADFSKMAADSNLFISSAIHNSVIKVDEKGTEAAAATIIAMDNLGAIEVEDAVILDRPFIYVIFDTESYTPVFIGQITNM